MSEGNRFIFRTRGNEPMEFVLVGLCEEDRGQLAQTIVAHGGITAAATANTPIAFARSLSALTARERGIPVILKMTYIWYCAGAERLLPYQEFILKNADTEESNEALGLMFYGVGARHLGPRSPLHGSADNLRATNSPSGGGMTGSQSLNNLNVNNRPMPRGAEYVPPNQSRYRPVATKAMSAHTHYTHDEKKAILHYIADRNIFDQCHGHAVFERMIREGVVVDRTPGALYNIFRKVIRYELNEVSMTFGLSTEQIRKFKAIFND